MNGNGHGLAVVAEAPVSANVTVEAGESFVVTPDVRGIAARALAYLGAGYPVHFSGPAGTGKTTLALHVAALRGRPVTLMHGDDEFGSSDLVGGDYGYRKSKLIDNFIHSVVKTEESVNTLWADNRLTLACKNGDTLVYDEFTRSRPEANNALLSVLEERLLTLPRRQPHGDGYLEVRPEFRAIFTSNPEEYAGVHRTQDALMDRLITIKIDYYHRETEVEITRAKSGLPREEAEVVVDVVRELRSLGVTKQGPSLRASIMIARVARQQGAHPRPGDPVFGDICRDVLGGLTAKVTRDGAKGLLATVDEVVAKRLKEAHRRPRADGAPGPATRLPVEKGA
ncbi:MAG: gas vesicle protein GvpN [Deltaproteobacteria bacterium]|nr:gas vesicle protein GvpN [Deltaproteobacteria bacterium]